MSWLVRSSNDRVLSGLSGGIADHLGISSTYVRAGFITLSFAGLIGLLAYAAGWLVTMETRETPTEPRRATPQQMIGMALMFAGLLVALRAVGLWFGAVSWAVAAASFGSAVLWDQNLRGSTESQQTGLGRWKRPAGLVLVIVGIGFVVTSVGSLAQLGPVVLGAAAAIVGVMLIFGPRIAQLGTQLTQERRDRIASEERAKIAADLHDSVLQSLAMIQRTDDAPTMVTIARAQERELRSWLYGRRSGVGEKTLNEALLAVAERVERDHNVPIEVVVVKDIPMTNRVEPLIRAAAEAMLNAARHSEAPRISVFAEVIDGQVEMFVSDTGKGFDIATIPDDRHGVRQSLLGRMERHGGTAEITTEPGEGTEVRLVMPLDEEMRP